jgi:putative DNA primase/helicase
MSAPWPEDWDGPPPGSGEGGPEQPAPHLDPADTTPQTSVFIVPDQEENPRVEQALAYQARGWRVIQLHGVQSDGVSCTCSKTSECRSAGKHPIASEWPNLPPMTEEEIRKAWSGWRRHHNIGLAAGKASGWFVVDVDPDKGGDVSLAQMLADHDAEEFDTYMVETGSGGGHYYFALPPDFDVTNSPGKLKKDYPGIDVRGNGGQVVAPPSVTDKGGYRVVNGVDIGPAPEWLLSMLRPKERTNPEPSTTPVVATGRHAAYAQKAWDGEVGRLDRMTEAATPDGTGYDGEPWNATVFEVCCKLQELANASWNDYTVEQAYADVMQHAPTDSGFTSEDVNSRWESAVRTVGDKARPTPADPGDVSDWDIPGDSTVAPAAKPKARRLPDPAEFFDEKDRLLSRLLGRAVLAMGPVAVGRDGQFWEYVDGVWRLNDHVVRDRVVDLVVNRYRQNMTGIARDVVARFARQIDCDPVPDLINWTNGMLRWRTGELEPHDPDHLSTVQLPVAWDPAAECPQFSAWLESMLESEYVHLVWQMIAYLLVSGNPLQTAFLLLGGGSNGKGVLLRVITALLGRENVSAVSLDDLTTNRFASSSLYGKTANIAGDIDSTFQVNTAAFKKITGEDSLQAERKHRDAFDFTCWAVPVFSANKIPGSADVTLGYLRRWVIVEFHRTIPDAEKILGLSDQFLGELPGIAAKAVAHLSVLDTGFDKVTRGQERFASEIDQVRQWVADATVGIEDAETPRTELYKAYRWWAEENGAGRLKAAEFFRRLEDLGFQQKKVHGVRLFAGIATASPATPAPWFS